MRKLMRKIRRFHNKTFSEQIFGRIFSCMHKNRPSKTAELAAFTRHQALCCPEVSAICADPFARLFLGWSLFFPYWFTRLILRIDRLHGWLKGKQPLGFMFPICRHRFMNDQLRASIDEGYTQIILIGAGYDTTAIRYQNRMLQSAFIEIDHPATQGRKIRILNAHSEIKPEFVKYLSADLSNSRLSQILKDIISPDKKCLVLAEGLLSYLAMPVLTQLVMDAAQVSKQVRFAADYRYKALTQPTVPERARSWLRDFSSKGESYTSFFDPKEMEDLVRRAGFTITDHKNLADVWQGLCPELAVPNHLINVAGIIAGQKG
jgi:methyltransferase (TIGR00027 family)